MFSQRIAQKQDDVGHFVPLDGPDLILHIEMAGGVDCDDAENIRHREPKPYDFNSCSRTTLSS